MAVPTEIACGQQKAKAAELREFFGGRELPVNRKMVCPFGREAAAKNEIVYVELSEDKDRWHEAIFAAARTYRSERRPALVIISPEDPPDHMLSRLQTHMLFVAAGFAIEHQEKAATPDRLTAYWYGKILPALLAKPDVNICPTVGVAEPHNVIAFSSCHDPTHFRYAPHLALAVVRWEDILRTGHENMPVAKGINREMIERLRALGLLIEREEGEECVMDNQLYCMRGTQVYADPRMIQLQTPPKGRARILKDVEPAV